MVSKKNKAELRQKKHARIRNRLSGTPERPRLAVFRSNKHMYAQLIDDVAGTTLCAASTLDKNADLQFSLLVRLLLRRLLPRESRKSFSTEQVSCIMVRFRPLQMLQEKPDLYSNREEKSLR